jgi:glutamate/tyrosine decarboxylase-like PLP-dependent enzyme
MSQQRSREQHERLLSFADYVARRVDDGPVATRVTPTAARARIAERFDLNGGAPPERTLRRIEDMLRRFAVHVSHRRYFGLFNPSVLPETVAAAALVAAYNPQEAAWEHSPGALEMEKRALDLMAERIGLPRDSSSHFTSGGQEANLTALVVALQHAFPNWRRQGVRAFSGGPTLYVSAEGHHSLVKAARVAGLGDDAVRSVPVDARHAMDADALTERIAEDRRARALPFMVVATAGTTATGAIDPLPALSAICRERGLWFHCDAAWAGAALLSPTLRSHLDGIAHADSVTWDTHKWLGAPMGAGAFFCRHAGAPRATFEVDSGYMPPPREGADDPHRTSLAWSRRAAGVPVFAAFATRGLRGYAELVDHQTQMGDTLRVLLVAAGFILANNTPLPLVCFTHPRIVRGDMSAGDVARAVVESGRAWISPVLLPDGTRVLRACITSYRTDVSDLEVLVDALTEAVGA